jgi:hypothetical protein
MDTQKMNQVIEALGDFILRASKDGATAGEVAALPAVAKILLDYWRCVSPR